MTNLKEQAIEMLYLVPDDKMAYVIDMLRWLNNIFDDKKRITTSEKYSEAIEAWEELKKYKSIIPYDIDEKAELEDFKADFIVTRNTKDFQSSVVPVIEPSRFIEKFI